MRLCMLRACPVEAVVTAKGGRLVCLDVLWMWCHRIRQKQTGEAVCGQAALLTAPPRCRFIFMFASSYASACIQVVALARLRCAGRATRCKLCVHKHGRACVQSHTPDDCGCWLAVASCVVAMYGKARGTGRWHAVPSLMSCCLQYKVLLARQGFGWWKEHNL